MFNFIQIDYTVFTNKSAIIKLLLVSLILNLIFLGPIGYYFADSAGETFFNIIIGYLLINVVAPLFKTLPANLAFSLFGKKTMIDFFLKTLQDNKFPNYDAYITGDKWIDRVLTDTSLSCEERLAAGELGMIMSSIIAQSNLSNAQVKVVDALSSAIERYRTL
tara:strand:+ start:677 stop:1165 length:489 start_codon:yes stop_codon:yes gene_type:complete